MKVIWQNGKLITDYFYEPTSSGSYLNYLFVLLIQLISVVHCTDRLTPLKKK